MFVFNMRVTSESSQDKNIKVNFLSIFPLNATAKQIKFGSCFKKEVIARPETQSSFQFTECCLVIHLCLSRATTFISLICCTRPSMQSKHIDKKCFTHLLQCSIIELSLCCCQMDQKLYLLL